MDAVKEAIEHNNRGVEFCTNQQLKEALACFNRAINLRPLYVEARNNRGILLHSLQFYKEALDDLRLAVKLTYNDCSLHVSLAHTLHHLWRLEEALVTCDIAIKIDPNYVNAHVCRANILQSLKRYREAIESYDNALGLDPRCSPAASNKVFTSDLMPNMGFVEHQQVRREWYATQVAHIKPMTLPDNNPDPDRRLVIGYLSADFRDHSAVYGIRPVLQHHDHANVKVICYALMTVEDEITQELRHYADIWRRVNGLDDEGLINQIREDKPDILVDLAGHTSDQRLAVFAHRLAPVQITAWGYATGTGCPFIDYLFSDPILIPPSVRHLYAETIFDLPCAFCYGPRLDIPDVDPLPCDANGYITFGNYNRESKTTPEALDLWASILIAVPNSRMIFKATAFKEPGRIEPILKAFTSRGIAADRITFKLNNLYREHMQSFGLVDIALDTFPHNGGISTWEPLWMGVPVVCKVGNSHPSRISAAILHALGLSEWVADGNDAYIKVAVTAANNVDVLREFRKSARNRIMQSAGGNPALYTVAVEQAYRTIWRKWCEQQGADNGYHRREGAKLDRNAGGANLCIAN